LLLAIRETISEHVNFEDTSAGQQLILSKLVFGEADYSRLMNGLLESIDSALVCERCSTNYFLF